MASICCYPAFGGFNNGFQFDTPTLIPSQKTFVAFDVHTITKSKSAGKPCDDIHLRPRHVPHPLPVELKISKATISKAKVRRLLKLVQWLYSQMYVYRRFGRPQMELTEIDKWLCQSGFIGFPSLPRLVENAMAEYYGLQIHLAEVLWRYRSVARIRTGLHIIRDLAFVGNFLSHPAAKSVWRFANSIKHTYVNGQFRDSGWVLNGEFVSRVDPTLGDRPWSVVDIPSVLTIVMNRDMMAIFPAHSDTEADVYCSQFLLNRPADARDFRLRRMASTPSWEMFGKPIDKRMMYSTWSVTIHMQRLWTKHPPVATSSAVELRVRATAVRRPGPPPPACDKRLVVPYYDVACRRKAAEAEHRTTWTWHDGQVNLYKSWQTYPILAPDEDVAIQRNAWLQLCDENLLVRCLYGHGGSPYVALSTERGWESNRDGHYTLHEGEPRARFPKDIKRLDPKRTPPKGFLVGRCVPMSPKEFTGMEHATRLKVWVPRHQFETPPCKLDRTARMQEIIVECPYDAVVAYEMQRDCYYPLGVRWPPRFGSSEGCMGDPGCIGMPGPLSRGRRRKHAWSGPAHPHPSGPFVPIIIPPQISLPSPHLIRDPRLKKQLEDVHRYATYLGVHVLQRQPVASWSHLDVTIEANGELTGSLAINTPSHLAWGPFSCPFHLRKWIWKNTPELPQNRLAVVYKRSVGESVYECTFAPYQGSPFELGLCNPLARCRPGGDTRSGQGTEVTLTHSVKTDPASMQITRTFTDPDGDIVFKQTDGRVEVDKLDRPPLVITKETGAWKAALLFPRPRSSEAVAKQLMEAALKVSDPSHPGPDPGGMLLSDLMTGLTQPAHSLVLATPNGGDSTGGMRGVAVLDKACWLLIASYYSMPVLAFRHMTPPTPRPPPTINASTASVTVSVESDVSIIRFHLPGPRSQAWTIKGIVRNLDIKDDQGANLMTTGECFRIRVEPGRLVGQFIASSNTDHVVFRDVHVENGKTREGQSLPDPNIISCGQGHVMEWRNSYRPPPRAQPPSSTRDLNDDSGIGSDMTDEKDSSGGLVSSATATAIPSSSVLSLASSASRTAASSGSVPSSVSASSSSSSGAPSGRGCLALCGQTLETDDMKLARSDSGVRHAVVRCGSPDGSGHVAVMRVPESVAIVGKKPGASVFPNDPSYACNVCGSPTNWGDIPFYHCARCDYDICPDCAHERLERQHIMDAELRCEPEKAERLQASLDRLIKPRNRWCILKLSLLPGTVTHMPAGIEFTEEGRRKFRTSGVVTRHIYKPHRNRLIPFGPEMEVYDARSGVHGRPTIYTVDELTVPDTLIISDDECHAGIAAYEEHNPKAVFRWIPNEQTIED